MTSTCTTDNINSLISEFSDIFGRDMAADMEETDSAYLPKHVYCEKRDELVELLTAAQKIVNELDSSELYGLYDLRSEFECDDHRENLEALVAMKRAIEESIEDATHLHTYYM